MTHSFLHPTALTLVEIDDNGIDTFEADRIVFRRIAGFLRFLEAEESAIASSFCNSVGMEMLGALSSPFSPWKPQHGDEAPETGHAIDWRFVGNIEFDNGREAIVGFSIFLENHGDSVLWIGDMVKLIEDWS